MHLLRKGGAIAAAIALIGAAPVANAACPLDGATPFTAGPVSPLNGFAQYVLDTEGKALEICLTGDGAGICFFDPVDPANPFSVQIGFGAEGFWWLSEGAFTTANGTDVLVVMAAEAAFVAEVPGVGEQFPFTRLRIRMDIPQEGIYTLVHPFGTYTAVIPAAAIGPAQEVRESFDIEFRPNATNQGRVGPWLRHVDATGAPMTFDANGASPPVAAGPRFIGDGGTRPITGSPCGTNFLRLSATSLDGLSPIDLNGAAPGNDAEFNQFVVHGQLFAGNVLTPLAASAGYSRSATETRVNVFAKAPTTAAVVATPGGVLTGDGSGRFFASSVVTAIPSTVSVTADNNPPVPNNLDNTQVVPVFDVVAITKAEAVCTGAPKTCSVTVEANSSDKATTGAPTLSITNLGTAPIPLTAGTATVTGLTVLPAVVNVSSTAGGSDSEPVKVINQ
jgi:hypothetical protein